MPLQRPDIEQVKNLAGKFGIDLTDTEARLFRIRILEHIEAMEQFQELRIEEDQPPLRYFDRDAGYRPTEAEDPLNAFIRKCRVKGAPDGPLAGKTVGLSKHLTEDLFSNIVFLGTSGAENFGYMSSANNL